MLTTEIIFFYKKDIANLFALGDTLSICPVEITLYTPPKEQRSDFKNPKEWKHYQVRQSLQGCWDNLSIPARQPAAD